jgi:hypothetical protein
MNLNILGGFLAIVERALQSPEDKAAVQIAIDGLAFWKDIAGNPKLARLEADIAAYAALPPPPAAAPAPVEPAKDGVRGGPRGGLMAPGV